MILITGASGKTGRAITRALAQRGAPVRALVRRAEQADAALALGAAESQVGDLLQRADLERAMQGVQAVYHICPNMHPAEVALAEMAFAAARTAGVEHFVYHSVLHPQVEAMPHHWNKLLAEQRLFESGLCYTILQPAAYMQNVLAQWRAMTEQGRYPVPYAVETRLSMVDLDDVAAVAAAVLTEPGHTGAIYELCGAEALSQAEVAAVVADQIGRPVQAECVPLAAWEKNARAGGLPDYAVTTLLRMFRYYEQYGFSGNPHVLEWLLGRPPTAFAAFVERTLQTTH
ncbi:MAG TPA: NmrA family NAD(P)-binding protein [Anaerolineaceae bacterium]|nr:NmrA family NAD(P)-binding protein [Anaerolineaceae bacterium]